jgi:sulfur relay (sulfurtransferase) complex TusBCD TusD component (DsrE family)
MAMPRMTTRVVDLMDGARRSSMDELAAATSEANKVLAF